MNPRLGAFAALLIAVTAAGVVVLARREPSPRGERLRGTVSAPGAPVFTPCDGASTYRLTDRSGGVLTGLLRREAAGAEPLYVEAIGRLEPAGTAVVTDVRFAARETAGCRSRLEDVIVRALGNEPFWAVTVLPSEIRFEAPDVAPVAFPAVAPRRGGDTRVYETRRPDGRRLRLVLREAACGDGMSDAYYALTSAAELDGRAYTGCAREGWR